MRIELMSRVMRRTSDCRAASKVSVFVLLSLLLLVAIGCVEDPHDAARRLSRKLEGKSRADVRALLGHESSRECQASYTLYLQGADERPWNGSLQLHWGEQGESVSCSMRATPLDDAHGTLDRRNDPTGAIWIEFFPTNEAWDWARWQDSSPEVRGELALAARRLVDAGLDEFDARLLLGEPDEYSEYLHYPRELGGSTIVSIDADGAFKHAFFSSSD